MLNLYYQSHLGNQQIQGFAVNYRSIWSLWVVSRVASFIVAQELKFKPSWWDVGCTPVCGHLHLSLRATLYLQGNFEAQLSSFGVWFPYVLFFQACV